MARAGSPPSAPRTPALPKGKTQPRLFTEPLRPLNRKTSHGYAVADFAELAGEPLSAWERWVAIHALELLPDGSYRFRVVMVLCARQNGKSHLVRMIVLWRMYMQPRLRALGVAQDVSLAREQWTLAQDTIYDCPDLAAEFNPARKTGKLRGTNGDEMFYIENGSRWKIAAANRKAGRGGSNDLVIIDELREQRSWDAWAALSKTTLARPNSMIFAMSNQGDDQAVVLHQLRAAALAETDPSLGIFEYSAPDGCELDDWHAIAQANPALGIRINHGGIKSALTTDPPGVFRTEVLCQYVDHLDSAIDLGAWNECADPAGTMKGLRSRVALAFDIAPDGEHATLAVAGRLNDGRIRVEILASWKTTEEARVELPGLIARARPVAFGWYPAGPAAALAPLLRPLKNSVELSGAKVTEACQGLADLVTARRIVHPADPLLDAHIGGAQKLASGDGWRFTRAGQGGHVDAAYAAAGVVYAVETLVVQNRSYIRVLSA